MEKDKHDEDNSSRELDDFIAAETSSNTVKKTEYKWKKFEGFCEQQADGNFNVMIIPAAALDKLHDKLKMSEAKWRRVRTYQFFKLSNKHRRIIFFLLVFLFLLLVFLQKLNKVGSAPKRCHILSLRQQPSVQFPTVFNLVQSAPNDPPGSFHENAAKHQKLDAIRWKNPCFVFDRMDKIHTSIHLTLTLNKVSCYEDYKIGWPRSVSDMSLLLPINHRHYNILRKYLP